MRERGLTAGEGSVTIPAARRPSHRDTHTGDSNMAGFPENDIDEDEWDNDEDEREVARQQNRWSPEDDEVESLIDFADCNED